MNNQLVFLLYDNRSGSTYLSALLNRYKGVSVSLESSFVSHIIEYPGEISTQNVDEIINYLQQEVQFRELGLDVEALKRKLNNREGGLSRKLLIQTIIRQYFSARDAEAECYIIKHPPYAYLPIVTAMFPNVKFLQIIRDGRAVLNSKLKTNKINGDKMTTNPLKAAWDWRAKLKKAEQVEKRTINIFYEDLVERQEEALARVLSQLNISTEGQMITKQQSDYFHHIGKEQKPLHENVAKSPQKTAINKWKQELRREYINLYNFVNRRYLQKYHYKIDQPVPRSTIIYYIKYVLLFVAEKVKNVTLMLRKPQLLRLKIYRNYGLFNG